MTIPKIIRNFLIVLGIVIGILPIPVYRYVSLHGNIIFPLRFLALIHQDTSYYLLWNILNFQIYKGKRRRERKRKEGDKRGVRETLHSMHGTNFPAAWVLISTAQSTLYQEQPRPLLLFSPPEFHYTCNINSLVKLWG